MRCDAAYRGDWKKAWEKAKQRAGAILKRETEESQSAAHKVIRERNVAAPKNKLNCKNEKKKSEALKCRFHDLRHTAVACLLEAGISYPVVASMMSWSAAAAIRMAKRYGHIGNQSARRR